MMELISKMVVLILMFLFGLQCLRIGLYQLSYQRSKDILHRFSRTPLLAIVTGFAATCLLQSSSVVIVIAMGLITTKYMTIRQGIGIMLGANLGTTLTGEILSISFDPPYALLLAVGAVLIMMQKRKLFASGTIIFGLSAIFLALDNFSGFIEEVMRWPLAATLLLQMNESNLAALLFGIIGTAIIQSSSAMFGITISLLQADVISMTGAFAILLGSNIGTCITAGIAGLTLDKQARVIASSHLWYNVIGVILALPLLAFIDRFSGLLADDPAKQLAHLSVLFNTLTILLFYPFLHLFESFLTRKLQE
ncbi:Na/Pi symporter [Thalassobacillus hwangdonensis]|uniref:Na/Pi symporter n=1 Tax=Thalassobacillus hwangdonensis TaxID=546108 RepID=A0ABW3KZ29_9BACI